jgi:hypothetical protein
MCGWQRPGRFTWLGIGLAVGLMVGGFWPQTPLHAVATDRLDTFAMATGPLDENIEAVYFLDFLTGDLRAVALGRMTGKFTGFFAANVAKDMEIEPGKARFMMVTGMADLRRGGGSQLQPSRAVLYVADVTSGVVAAYYVPWSPSLQAAGKVIVNPLQRLDMARFRSAGPGAAPTK